MKTMKINELEAIVGMTSVALPDEVLFSVQSQRVFIEFFKNTEALIGFQDYLTQDQELFEMRSFRNILSQKGILELYKSDLPKFMKSASQFLNEIKSSMIEENIKTSHNTSKIDHPIYFTNFDLRGLTRNCKANFIEKMPSEYSLEVFEIGYYLTISIFLSSEHRSPKIARQLRKYFETLGLNSDRMKPLLEKAENDLHLLQNIVPRELTNFEKKHLLLMAVKVAATDLNHANDKVLLTLDRYKTQLHSNKDELKIFKKFHYFRDPFYMRNSPNFSDEVCTKILAFFITCLKADEKVETIEKEMYVRFIKKLGVELTEEKKVAINQQTANFQTEKGRFLDTFTDLNFNEKFFIALSSLEILAADRSITKKEEELLSPLVEDLLKSLPDDDSLKVSFLLFLDFLVNNFKTYITTHLVSEIENFLLKKSEEKFSIGLYILLIIYSQKNEIHFEADLLAMLKKIFTYHNCPKNLLLLKDFEENFPAEAKEIKQNPILSYSTEVFLRLILQSEKCLELESFKDALINLTAAHIEMAIEHRVFSENFKNLINHLTFELKIKNSSIEVRKKAIEIACELALADDNLSTEEHDIINKFTKELFLDEIVSFELNTKIIAYSDLKIILHDYLDYDEYKKR